MSIDVLYCKQFTFAIDKLKAFEPGQLVHCQNTDFVRQNSVVSHVIPAVDEMFTALDLNSENLGVIVNTTHVFEYYQKQYFEMYKKRGIASPLRFLNTTSNLLSGIICISFGVAGTNFSIFDSYEERTRHLADLYIKNGYEKKFLCVDLRHNNLCERDIDATVQLIGEKDDK